MDFSGKCCFMFWEGLRVSRVEHHVHTMRTSGVHKNIKHLQDDGDETWISVDLSLRSCLRTVLALFLTVELRIRRKWLSKLTREQRRTRTCHVGYVPTERCSCLTLLFNIQKCPIFFVSRHYEGVRNCSTLIWSGTSGKSTHVLRWRWLSWVPALKLLHQWHLGWADSSDKNIAVFFSLDDGWRQKTWPNIAAHFPSSLVQSLKCRKVLERFGSTIISRIRSIRVVVQCWTSPQVFDFADTEGAPQDAVVWLSAKPEFPEGALQLGGHLLKGRVFFLSSSQVIFPSFLPVISSHINRNVAATQVSLPPELVRKLKPNGWIFTEASVMPVSQAIPRHMGLIVGIPEKAVDKGIHMQQGLRHVGSWW